MQNSRRIQFTALLFIFTLVFVAVAFQAFSQGKSDWKNVTFATHQDALKFFDQNTGRVYVYSENDGKLLHVWAI
jgi:hypothetical protein